MPHHVQYQARRSLIAGHTAGTTYTWDIGLAGLDRQRKPERSRQVSLGGRAYTTYLRGETVWVCESAAVTGAVADQWREFLDSVEDGQLFGFGPYTGAAYSPTDRRSVVIDSDGYSERRAVRRSVGGQADYFQFTFRVLESV